MRGNAKAAWRHAQAKSSTNALTELTSTSRVYRLAARAFVAATLISLSPGLSWGESVEEDWGLPAPKVTTATPRGPVDASDIEMEGPSGKPDLAKEYRLAPNSKSKDASSGDEQSRRRAMIQLGRRLFHHTWEPGVSLAEGGDGLGPMFNDVSCVACHFQGGAGGGGTNDKNATMATMVPPEDGMAPRKFLRTATQIHPSFVSAAGDFITSIVMHKGSRVPRYNRQRQMVMALAEPHMFGPVGVPGDTGLVDVQTLAAANPPVHSIEHPSGVTVFFSERNSPSLFGLGLLDRVPDGVIQELSRQQAAKGIVSGRVSRVRGRVGRFGWKGQIATLREFVRGACTNELGLQVPGGNQAPNPYKVDYRPAGLDLNGTQLNSLTAYVASLSEPRVVTPATGYAHKSATRGRELFNAIGCAECHVQSLGSGPQKVSDVYSDLLMHDMGEYLSSSPQQSRLITVGLAPPPASAAASAPYYGGSSVSASMMALSAPLGFVPSPGDREWRTAPLWGVSASAPYLHDGRAATLSEAILLHGGEAAFSAKRFSELVSDERQAVIDFLNTLVPPESDIAKDI